MFFFGSRLINDGFNLRNFLDDFFPDLLGDRFFDGFLGDRFFLGNFFDDLVIILEVVEAAEGQGLGRDHRHHFRLRRFLGLLRRRLLRQLDNGGLLRGRIRQGGLRRCRDGGCLRLFVHQLHRHGLAQIRRSLDGRGLLGNVLGLLVGLALGAVLGIARLGRILAVLLTLGAILVTALGAVIGISLGLLALGAIVGIALTRLLIGLAGLILLALRAIIGVGLALGAVLGVALTLGAIVRIPLGLLALGAVVGIALARLLIGLALGRILGVALLAILGLAGLLGAKLRLFVYLLRAVLGLLGDLLGCVLALFGHLLGCVLALLRHLLGYVLAGPDHLLDSRLGLAGGGCILGIQVCHQLIHRGIALLGPDGGALLQGGPLPGGQAGDHGPVDGGILHHPVGGIGRNFAGGAVEDVGAEGVNVSPGAQGTPALVLLDGSEAMLQNGLGGLGQILVGILAFHIPHRAEVQQLYASIGEDHDVVGTDVPVDDARLVHRDHGIHDGAQDPQGLLDPQAAAVHVHVAPKVNALHILHDDVGGIVLLEKVSNVHNTRHIGQLCQGLGFAHKALSAALEQGTGLVFADGDLQRQPAVTGNEAVGVIFLNGHRGVQELIPAKIRDTEAALAQALADHILVVQHRAEGQLMGLVLCVFVEAAVLADGGLGL